MEIPPLKSNITKKNARAGRVTREMVEERTRALAVIAGRVPPYVTQADYEEAKRQLKTSNSPRRTERRRPRIPNAD